MIIEDHYMTCGVEETASRIEKSSKRSKSRRATRRLFELSEEMVRE